MFSDVRCITPRNITRMKMFKIGTTLIENFIELTRNYKYNSKDKNIYQNMCDKNWCHAILN